MPHMNRHINNMYKNKRQKFTRTMHILPNHCYAGEANATSVVLASKNVISVCEIATDGILKQLPSTSSTLAVSTSSLVL